MERLACTADAPRRSSPSKPCRLLEDVLVLDDDVVHGLRVEGVQYIALQSKMSASCASAPRMTTYPELAVYPHDRAVCLTKTLVELEALPAIQLLEVSCTIEVNLV